MKLIYIMDPLCGWCYGNIVNTQKIYNKYKDILDFELLPAGMWTGANTRSQSKAMAQYFKKHDLQVEQTTGTEFGEDYFILIEDENIVLDSELPSRAIVAVKKLWPEKTVSFTAEVQKARYLHGKDLNSNQTYLQICDDLKLDIEQFIEAFHSDFIKKDTLETFEQARQYATSYPTLLLEIKNKKFILEQGYAGFETIVERIEKLIY
ncbi:DsbA family protein [Flavobacterium pectinovorum]|uniref:DsbA family protein n=1 Tax=Flavobacterium pectinovorum TaxID=29533 RepID=UPI001FAE5068|nr:DsbA family protein [Flavobacterium pectinovorum]